MCNLKSNLTGRRRSSCHAGWWATISRSANFLSSNLLHRYWVLDCLFVSVLVIHTNWESAGFEWELAGFDTVPSTWFNFSSPVR
jgi:hypothetical protein